MNSGGEPGRFQGMLWIVSRFVARLGVMMVGGGWVSLWDVQISPGQGNSRKNVVVAQVTWTLAPPECPFAARFALPRDTNVFEGAIGVSQPNLALGLASRSI